MTSLDNFGEVLYQAFQQAERVGTVATERFYCIADQVIYLRFAGEALVPLMTPAFSHLAVPPHPTPALTVCLWDSAATGVDLPAFPAEFKNYVNQEKGWGIQSKRFSVFFEPANQIFRFLDKYRNLAIYWIYDAQQLPLYEGGIPLLTILYWWMVERGRQVVHAAAVGTEKGGVLLVGKSGSGKSTTALRCLKAGLLYLSDDYCLVSDNTNPDLYSLYNSGKVHFADVESFSCLVSASSKIDYTHADKSLYFFHERFSSQIVSSLPLRAILVPIITGEPTTQIKQITAAAAWLAMVPNTTFQLSGARMLTTQALSRLVQRVSVYRLELGTDMEQIPVKIVELIDELYNKQANI